MSVQLKLTPMAQAWIDGIKAFQSGAGQSDNPYLEEDTREQWDHGWCISEVVAPKYFGKTKEVAYV